MLQTKKFTTDLSIVLDLSVESGKLKEYFGVLFYGNLKLEY